MPDNKDLWGRRQDLAERHPIISLAYWGLGITFVVLVIAAVVGLASTGSIFFRSASSNATLKARENIQRNDTNNTTASIAFFHDQCNAVRRDLATYAVNKRRYDGLIKVSNGTDPVRAQQASDQIGQAATDVTAPLNGAIAAANDYNAKAANSLTAKFRESGLPARIAIPPDPPADITVNCG